VNDTPNKTNVLSTEIVPKASSAGRSKPIGGKGIRGPGRWSKGRRAVN
jgi:hypothetical protein